MGWNPFKSVKKAFKKVVKGVTKVFKGVTKIIGKVFSAVGSFVSGLMGGMFDTPDMGSVDQATANNEGVLLNRTGTTYNIPVVYGQRRVGGTIAFMATDGSRNENLYMAVILSEGEIEAIDDVYIDGINTTTDNRYDQFSTIEKRLGTDNQSVVSFMKEAPGWDDNCTLNGIAYLACKFTYPEIKTQEDQDKNPWQGLPQITAVIRGKKVKSMAGLTNSHSTAYADETGLIWSVNPADIIADYLRNPRYGRGLTNDRINFESFSTARSNYETTVTYDNGTTGPLYRINAVVNTGGTLMDNVKKLLVHCRSGLPYVQGKFKIKPQDSGSTTSPVDPNPTSVFDINETHIIDGVEINDSGLRDRANQVKVTYVDPDSDWSTNEIIYPTNNSTRDQQMLAEDDNRRLTKEYNFEYCIDNSIAAYLAKISCENERNIKTLSMNCTSELHEVEVGDIVKVNYSLLGITNLFCRVVAWELEADYTITLTLREHTAGTYVFSNSEAYIGRARQKRYVGDTQRATAYAYNSTTGKYEPIPVSQDGSLAQLPSTPTPPRNDYLSSFYKINSATVVATYDNPSFAYEIVKLNLSIPNVYVDNASLINIQELNYNTGFYDDLVTLNPGVHRVSGGGTNYENYEVEITVEMDGATHEFRVSSRAFNKFIWSALKFNFVSSRSKFIRVIKAFLGG